MYNSDFQDFTDLKEVQCRPSTLYRSERSAMQIYKTKSTIQTFNTLQDSKKHISKTSHMPEEYNADLQHITCLQEAQDFLKLFFEDFTMKTSYSPFPRYLSSPGDQIIVSSTD